MASKGTSIFVLKIVLSLAVTFSVNFPAKSPLLFPKKFFFMECESREAFYSFETAQEISSEQKDFYGLLMDFS